MTGPPVSAAFEPDGQPTPAALGFASKQGVDVRGARARRRRRRASTSRSASGSAARAPSTRCRTCSAACCAAWRSRSRCTGTRSSTTAGASCCSAGRSAGCCSCTAAASCRSRSTARPDAAEPAGAGRRVGRAVTYGHRFLATSGRAGRAIKVAASTTTSARLPENFVVLERAERRDRIARELEPQARRLGGRVQLHGARASAARRSAGPGRVPGVVAGLFDATFLELPEEVLTTTLIHHQHFFPVVDEDGQLQGAFLAVINTQPDDERADREQRRARGRGAAARCAVLLGRGPQVAARVAARAARHGPVPQEAGKLPRQGRAHRAAGAVDRARRARAAGRRAEHAARAGAACEGGSRRPTWSASSPSCRARWAASTRARRASPSRSGRRSTYHYLPVGVEADAPPSREQLGRRAVTWAAVSLADKLDTLVGLFAAGERPTGSRDPFGLRRQRTGVVRILVDLPELTGSLARSPAATARRAAASVRIGGDAGRDGAWPAFLGERLRYRARTARRSDRERARAATRRRWRRQPAACAARAEALPGDAHVGRISSARRAVQAGEEHRAGADSPIARRWTGRQRLTEPAEKRAAGGARRAAARDRARRRTTAITATRLTEIAALAAGGRSVLHGSVRDGRRSSASGRAADADGGLRDLILELADISEIVPQTEYDVDNGKEARTQVDTGKRPKAGQRQAAKTGKARKYVYFFGNGKADGNRTHEGPARRQGLGPRRDDQRRPAGAARVHDLDRGLQHLLQRKAARSRRAIDSEMIEQPRASWKRRPARSSATSTNPLLVSVRSGAKFSMPGMMDTILNLGLNDQTVEGLEGADRQRPLRLRQLSPLHPDVRQRRARDSEGRVRARVRSRSSTSAARTLDTDLDETALRDVVARYKEVVQREDAARRSRRIRSNSCAARATRCSAPGTTRAPSNTAASTTSRTRSARRSTCR